MHSQKRLRKDDECLNITENLQVKIDNSTSMHGLETWFYCLHFYWTMIEVIAVKICFINCY